MKSGMNLQRKAIFIVAGILLFILSSNTFVLTYIATKRYERAILAEATAKGEGMQREFNKVLNLGVTLKSFEGVNERLKEFFSREETVGYAMVMDLTGKILFHNEQSTIGKELKDKASLKAVSSDKILVQIVGSFYDLSFPLLDAEGKMVGAFRVGVYSEVIKSQVYELMFWALGISAICFLLSLGLVYLFISKFITQPIIKFRDVAIDIAKGDLDKKIRVRSSDEIGQLGVAFNKMSEDLKKLLQKEKELAAAAAEAAERERAKAEELKKAYHELRDTQAMLVQSEKLSALGELGAGVAHELNSPLAGILSLLRTYLKGKDPNSEEYQDLKDVKEACEHIAKIIKDFSSFTRKSTGELTDVNIINVIESTLSFGARQLERQGIKIEKNYDNGLPLIKGDESQLRQVVLNMITNARDAISGEGTLKITTRKGNADKGQFVEMEFSDTGVGINKEDIGKIFDPFFTTKRPGRGVGLGLSITHTIVKNHNGEILVDSELGKGTTFIIRLPVTS
jgi:two-component system NtrC family sensor kinase